jgi:hypothetical protein
MAAAGRLAVRPAVFPVAIALVFIVLLLAGSIVRLR